jgi:Flp pilus assembly protein TadD
MNIGHVLRPRRLALAAVLILAGCATANRPQTVTDDMRARLAKALLEAGDPVNAEEALRKPESRAVVDMPDPMMNARMLIAAGKVDAGLNVAEAALAVRGDDPAFALEVASLAMTANRIPRADRIYRAILERHRYNIEAMNGDAVVLAQGGDLESAIALLRRALVVAPGDVPARSNLALMLLLSGRASDAIPILEDVRRVAQSPQIESALAAARAQASTVRSDAPRTDVPVSSGRIDVSPILPPQPAPVQAIPATTALPPSSKNEAAFAAPPSADPSVKPSAQRSGSTAAWSCPATCQMLNSLLNRRAESTAAN